MPYVKMLELPTHVYSAANWAHLDNCPRTARASRVPGDCSTELAASDEATRILRRPARGARRRFAQVLHDEKGGPTP
jgi:hypothetical protein